MKKSVLYERNGRLFLRTRSKTTDGVWMDDGPCIVTATSEPAAAIGTAVLDLLSKSKEGVAHPKAWDAQSRPLLEAAGVRTWAEFRKRSKCVTIAANELIRIQPSHNTGSGGYVALEGDAVSLPVDSSADAIGDAIAAAIRVSRSK